MVLLVLKAALAAELALAESWATSGSGRQWCLSIPLKSCRPMSAKMESTKSVKMLTSRSRFTASMSARTIVRRPARCSSAEANALVYLTDEYSCSARKRSEWTGTGWNEGRAEQSSEGVPRATVIVFRARSTRSDLSADMLPRIGIANIMYLRRTEFK